MNKPKLSIIVAMYNTVDFLPQFFDCLFTQQFQNFEVIIVDDISTDGSKEYVKSLIESKSLNNYILVEGTEKMLPDKARQKAFALCKGEYVIYLDTDDQFSEDYLSSLVALMDENELDYAVSSCQRINEQGKKTNKKRYLYRKSLPLMSDEQKKILIRGRYGGWNRMVRKSYLIDHKYDYLSAELPLFILQFDENARVGYTCNGCYYYRARGGSISTSKVPQRIANYDVLEPISWYKNIQLSKSNKKNLGIYLYRMLLPYIYYKKYFVEDYDYKKDIKLVKKECNFTVFSFIKCWFAFDFRDKVIGLAFLLHLNPLIFRFIKKYRS